MQSGADRPLRRAAAAGIGQRENAARGAARDRRRPDRRLCLSGTLSPNGTVFLFFRFLTVTRADSYQAAGPFFSSAFWRPKTDRRPVPPRGPAAYLGITAGGLRLPKSSGGMRP